MHVFSDSGIVNIIYSELDSSFKCTKRINKSQHHTIIAEVKCISAFDSVLSFNRHIKVIET